MHPCAALEKAAGPPIDMGVVGTLVATYANQDGRTLTTEFSSATDINNAGQIILISTLDASPTPFDDENQPTCGGALWDQGVTTELEPCRPKDWTAGGVFYPLNPSDPPQAPNPARTIYNEVNDLGDILYHTYQPADDRFEKDHIRWSDGADSLPAICSASNTCAWSP